MSDKAADPWRLDRFVTAQDRGGTYQRAVAELRAGEKASHWMWFIFPQIAGLGLSEISQRYAIGSIAEARAYLAHPVLGPRLRECARIVADTEGRSADRIFGPVDAMKLRSSMTLFAAADEQPGESVFRAVLAKYFDGIADEATVTRLLLCVMWLSPHRQAGRPAQARSHCRARPLGVRTVEYCRRSAPVRTLAAGPSGPGRGPPWPPAPGSPGRVR